MRVEAVPVVGPCHGVPGPVRGLKILKDNPRLLVLFGRVAPDVEVSPGAPRLGASGPLEPGVLVRGVVQR